jgi:ABC-type glycerol-3-phosphate transport system substrate-binding protein
MKKNLFRISFIIMIMILLVITFTGCSRTDDAGEDEPESVFVPDFTSLSSLISHLPNVSNITVTSNNIYFTSTSDIGGTSLFRTTQIFTIELNQADPTRLSGYNALSNYTTNTPPTDADGGGTFINAIQVDDDGNLWVAETCSFVIFNFPSNFDINDAEESEIWEHHRPLKTSYAIRKLDSTGAELLTFDIDPVASATPDWVDITAFLIDDEGNIIIGTGQKIIVLDADGDVQFTLDADDFIRPESFIRLSDGRVAHSNWSFSVQSILLQEIDIHNKTWGAIIDLPAGTQGVFNGDDEYLILLSTNLDLLAIDKETNETIQLLNWAASGVESAGLDNVLFLPDDRILFTTTSRKQDETGQISRHTEMVVLNRIPFDEIREKTVITLASGDLEGTGISAAVAEFNRTNNLYIVEIVDIRRTYGTMHTDFERFALELIAGRGPDIIHTSNLQFHQWAGRGLFVDLYELIDADTRINRGDFVESVLRGLEMNGKLYQITPDFRIVTLMGNPNVLGSNPGWSIDEFMAVINANPQATLPMGDFTDGRSLLWHLISYDITSFVNWETGTVYFDNEYFISLLEFAYELNTRIHITWDGFPKDTYQLILSGEQIIYPRWFNYLWEYSLLQDIFGGDFVFKGYPVENGSGNFMWVLSGMAITTTSANQQGAWEFIRFFVSEEWQRRQFRSHIFDIPTNKAVLDLSFAEAMEERRNPITMGVGNNIYTVRPLTQEHVDNIRALIDSVSSDFSNDHSLGTIIDEGVNDFLNGLITAQDAARIIQSRASIYVAEQR